MNCEPATPTRTLTPSFKNFAKKLKLEAEAGAPGCRSLFLFLSTTNMSGADYLPSALVRNIPQTLRMAWAILAEEEEKDKCVKYAVSLRAALDHFTRSKNPRDGKTQLYYLDAAPHSGCIRITAQVREGECLVLKLEDMYMYQPGDATREYVLQSVKQFVRAVPVPVKVFIYPTKVFLMDYDMGCYYPERFQSLAARAGFEIGYPWVVYLSNEAQRCALTTGMVLHQKGVPAELHNLVADYLPCIYYGKIVVAAKNRRALKRQREEEVEEVDCA